MMTGGHATQQILELNLLELDTQAETLVALHDPLARRSLEGLILRSLMDPPTCARVLGRDVRNFGHDLLPSAFPLQHQLHDITGHIARILRAVDI